MLIRESFATNTSSPAIMNIPSGYIAFHILSNDHAYCADILVKLSLAKTCRATECSFQLTLLLSIYSRCMASSTLFLCTFDPPFKISRHNLTPVSADFSTNFCSLRWILIPWGRFGIVMPQIVEVWSSSFWYQSLYFKSPLGTTRFHISWNIIYWSFSVWVLRQIFSLVYTLRSISLYPLTIYDWTSIYDKPLIAQNLSHQHHTVPWQDRRNH